MKKILLKIWPFISMIFIVLVFFWKVLILGEVPIPGDFIVGTYYPWLDYKWNYQVGVPVKNPITSDVVSIVYPLRSFATEILKQGHLPLWNPFMFNGTPLLADFQVAVLSPTIIFYFFLPKIWAWSSQIVAQPILASFFTYLLLRHFGLKKIESIFGGIFYAFSGFNIIWMEWNANTLTAAFIPLSILLVDKFIKEGKLYWGLLLSVCICLQILSGYPQVAIYGMMAILILLYFRIKILTKLKIFQTLFFITSGLLLSSIIVVPGLEFILNSQRRYGLLESNLIYFPWQNLITFLAPDYFGNPATINYFGLGNYTVNAGYSGIVVFTLAIIGIFQYWGKIEVKYFLTLIVLVLLMTLPTPIAKAIFNSPIPAISASSTTRILVLVNLSLCILAAYGISTLFNKKKVASIGMVFIPLIILSIVSVFTFFIGINSSVSLRNMILPIALSVSTIVSLLIINTPQVTKNFKYTLIIGVCFLAVAELFRYGWKYTPFSSPKLIFPDTPVLTFFQDIKKPFRISAGNVVPMNMWVPYGLESVSGYDALYPIRWARLLNTINNQDIQFTTFSYYAPFEHYNSPWFDLLNNEYLMVLKPADKPENWPLIKQVQKLGKFKQVFQDKSVVIFKNTIAAPRAFFVSDWDIKSDEDALSVLMAPNFPLDKKIIIDRNINFVKSKDLQSNVVYSLYTPTKSILNINTNKDGFLFVSDAWYPGWKAKVDGNDTYVYKADYSFRAVPVTSGTHEVEFWYEPESLKLGQILSLATMVCLLGVFIYENKVFS